jgi:hypothetical protein
VNLVYLCKCEKCNREVAFRNSFRCWDLAYFAMQEFKDPEIAIAHSIELIELENELSRGKDLVFISYDNHIFPEKDCKDNPDVARKIGEDFIAREAFEIISLDEIR